MIQGTEAQSLPKTEKAIRSRCTYRELIDAIIEENPWTEQWLRDGCIIAMANSNDSWEVKDTTEKVPLNLSRLGCAGWDHDGKLHWIGFDLDVGHGGIRYRDTEEALVDGRKIQSLFGESEIRLSTGGKGVTVKYWLPEDSGLSKNVAARIAKGISKKLGLKADPSNLGRQCFWLWAREPAPRGYELISGQDKQPVDIPDAIMETLADAEYDPCPELPHKEYSQDDDNGSNEPAALADPDWKQGDISGRAPLGDRNCYDMRHLVHDWSLSISRAVAILVTQGCDICRNEKQWERIERYRKYPRGWKARRVDKDAKKALMSSPDFPMLDAGSVCEAGVQPGIQPDAVPSEVASFFDDGQKATVPPIEDGLPAFPLGAFPPGLAKSAKAFSDAAQMPPDMACLSMLASVAYLAAKRGVAVEWAPGMTETVNLYCMSVAPPSEHKTTVVEMVSAPLKGIQRQMFAKYDSEAAEYERRRMEIVVEGGKGTKARLEQLKAEGGPVRDRIMLDDTTPEAMAGILQHDKHCLFLSGEATIVDNMLSPYSKVQQLTPWLKLWKGEQWIVDRKGNLGPIVLDGCTVSMSICCQKSALRRMATMVKGSREVGLLSRFLYAVPSSLIGTRDQRHPGLTSEDREPWSLAVGRLWKEPARTLTLDAASNDALCAWAEEIESRLQSDLSGMADWAGKAQKGQLSRIAALLHLLWEQPGDAIGIAMMVRAILIGRYALAHAKAALELSQTTPEDDVGKRISQYVIRKPGKTTRDIVRSLHIQTSVFLTALKTIDNIESKDGKWYPLA